MIGISEALGYSLLGIAVVFLMLIILMVIIMVMGKVMKSGAAPAKSVSAPAPAAAAPAPAVNREKAPGTAGNIDLHSVEPKTAALIMAIVADEMGAPINELRFISIKEI